MNAPNTNTRADAGSLELRKALWAPSQQYAQAARLSLVISVLILAPSWYMFEVYGRVLNSRNEHTLAWLLLAAVCIYVVLELLELVRYRVLSRAADSIRSTLNERVFNANFQAKLRKQVPGVPQPLTDVKAVSEFVHSPAVTGLMDLPSALICLALLFAMNLWVGVLATTIALVQVGLGWAQQSKSAWPYGQALGASGSAQSRAQGTLRNAQVIEAMGMQSSMYRRWIRSQRHFIARLAQASDTAGGIGTATKLMGQLQGSLILGLACWASLHNDLLGGAANVIVASIIGGRALQPMAQIIAQWRQIGGAQAAYQRLSALLGQIPAAEQGMPLPPPQGQLVADNLIVTPPGGAAPVLKGVSFFAKPGEMLTIFGASAAGKTTLARALIGVWPSQGGKVRLDGADVFAWHKSQLGQHVGYLPQGVELFDGSIAENIARFGKVDMDKVKAAAQMAGVTALIEELPQGFDTQIGDDGAVLSGGQRQRIGLARALYGQPRLLVLDEPNSSLDEAGERELLNMIAAQKALGTTLIAITHRKSLLLAADRLLLLNDGTVARFGTRDEVMAALQAMAQQAAAKAAGAAAPAATPAAATQGASA